MADSDILTFGKTVLKSLYPHGYKDLHQRTTAQAIQYFFSLLILLFVAAAVLSLPAMLSFPKAIDEKLSLFAEFSTDWSIATDDPVFIPQKQPIVTFDSNDEVNFTKGLIYITNDEVYYRGKWNKIQALNASAFKEISGGNKQVTEFIFAIAIFLLPTVAIALFLIFALKYLFAAALFSLLGFIGILLSRSRLSLRECFLMALYATTVMMLLDLLLFPFQFQGLLMPFSILFGVSYGMISLTLFFILYALALVVASGKLHLR
ncbi:TPA: DUF1189 family protein [Candidatus Woesearchaeota archaeon]|nr:DUF1189 family protein [Candidatus Woesearchaeota archaeon]